MRGGIIEMLGLPVEFWSHCDVLNERFSSGRYEKQPVLLWGLDGHTAWANRALLQRAGITADFLKNLLPVSAATTASITTRTCSPMASWWTPAPISSTRCCPHALRMSC
jgi:predicted amidohydrolase YtcJ